MTAGLAAPRVEAETVAPSPFAPLRHRAFLVLWVATVIGNTGSGIRDTASAWMMTELAPTPVMVSLVQVAATLPIFLLSLPAGVLSDIVDRRCLMIGIQGGLCCVSVTLAVLTAMGAMSPTFLLALTLMAGIGNALAGPAWQSIVPELVPRAELRPAVTLNSLGINISRAIGPAIAAVAIITTGLWSSYLLDVCSYAVTLAALLWWRRVRVPPAVPERFAGALRAGARYAWASLPLRRVLARAFLFFTPASCCWALLPLLARTQLHGGAAEYGILLGAVGLGAVGGAFAIPVWRQWLSLEQLAFGAVLGMAAMTACLAAAGSVVGACVMLTLVGAAWITTLSTLNMAAQAVLPEWVRGRGLAVYLTVFFGSMTGGSVIWGLVAGATSIGVALVSAGLICAAGAVLARLMPLPAGSDDLTPSHHWPAPVMAEGVEPGDGPVMITVEYRIDPTDRPEFATAIARLARLRRRDGAFDWGVVADTANPTRVTEWFLVASWREHLRQHERVVVADRAVQDQVLAVHQGVGPEVRHLVPLGVR